MFAGLVLQSQDVRANCPLLFLTTLQVFCYHCQGEVYLLLRENFLLICAYTIRITGSAWLLSRLKKTHAVVMQQSYVQTQIFQLKNQEWRKRFSTLGSHMQLVLNASCFTGTVLLWAHRTKQSNPCEAATFDIINLLLLIMTDVPSDHFWTAMYPPENLLLLIAGGGTIWDQWLLFWTNTEEGEGEDLYCLLYKTKFQM